MLVQPGYLDDISNYFRDRKRSRPERPLILVRTYLGIEYRDTPSGEVDWTLVKNRRLDHPLLKGDTKNIFHFRFADLVTLVYTKTDRISTWWPYRQSPLHKFGHVCDERTLVADYQADQYFQTALERLRANPLKKVVIGHNSILHYDADNIYLLPD